MYSLLLYVVAGWSGCFVMAVELLGGRLLAPYFGSSIYVWGALITVFMLALSLGYLLGGRASLHRPSLRRLALILAAAALTMLPVLLAAEPLLDALSARFSDPRLGSLLSATALFLVPTAISGMVSPYAVRLLVADRQQAGNDAGKLYFVSTFGSAAGTLLTSFYLVLYLEVNQILWIMLAVSVLVSALAALYPAPRPAALGLLAVLAAVCAPRADALELLHSERSLYRQVLVYGEGNVRFLCFTRQCAIGRQSSIDLSQPDRLLFDYTHMMMAALFMGAAPRSVLVIGLGGGSLPRALAAALPAARIDAVEIDPAVTRVARQYFNFAPGPNVSVIEEDGRAYVKRALRAGRHYDLVMLDAYDHEYIPEHLLTREFLQEVKSLLTSNGVVAANTFSSSKLYDSESVTYRAVFGEFYNLKSANRVILARNGALPSLDEVGRNAAPYQGTFSRLGFSVEEVRGRFSVNGDWNPAARVLTDQYSPANLLNSSR